MNAQDSHDETDRQEKSESEPEIIPAKDLFLDADEVRIEHNGEVYRLRITRRNKLILQK